jgi:hypothetical protein
LPRTTSGSSTPGSDASVSHTSPTISVEALPSSSSTVTLETSPASHKVTSAHRIQSGPVVGGVVGGVFFLLILFALFLWHRRRSQAAKHVSSGNHPLSDPFMLEVPASPHLLAPGSSRGVPYIGPPGLSDSPIPEDSLGDPTPSTASGASASAISAVPLISSTVIKRQMQLREQEEENSRQMADLEARTRDSSQWVSRVEYEAELGRLRAEVEWLRDTQQSDWAMGLSDEVPPAYQRNSATNEH